MKNIWLWNHYAADMFESRGGRHYWFAENLIKQGHNVTIFCANTMHSFTKTIEIDKGKYVLDSVDGIPFIFVQTPSYKGNGIQRINNMVAFYRNLFPVTQEYAKTHGKPDIIVASSVHPLTLVAGIKIARKFGVPCICEVRDLWPESLVAYGIVSAKNLLTQVLYQGEKWIYKNADAIIMTFEGGKDYLVERGWNRQIDLEKVKCISNGVVLEKFDKNSLENPVVDADLDNHDFKNIVYAGAIRKVNNIGMLLDAAKIIQGRGIKDIRFLIYGDGDECEYLINRCKVEDIANVIFKGRVDKKCVPSILKKAYSNILHNTSTSLDKYGQSQNKFFEYLAAGKCIVQTHLTGYSICESAKCGICVPVQNPIGIANAIIETCRDEAKCREMGENARNAAGEFDFPKLTEKLISIIENAIIKKQ